MKRKCPSCGSTKESHSKSGYFRRKSDGRTVFRFKCRSCFKNFSEASFQKCCWQKKRRLNPRVEELLVSGVSQRRIARLLKVSRVTVVRKFVFLSSVAKNKNIKFLNNYPLVSEMQFDDLETIEHTKCKPLSVIMAVEGGSRIILGYRVSQMPAKGHLAQIAWKKYGYRPDKRPTARRELFEEIKPKLLPTATILSDMSRHYPKDLKKHFPHCIHKTTKGRRGCVAGQGELKKIGFDPLFSLNHTFAMLRANINRLFRRTWCTTKLPDRLDAHIAIYIYYHNKKLILGN